MPDLTTLASLKQYRSVTDTSLDALFTALIPRFTAYALNQTNRVAFIAQAYSEKYNGNGLYRISPRYAFASSPLTGIASLTVDGKAVPAVPSDTGSGYVFDDYTIYLRGCYAFCKGVQNVAITYTSGLATIPGELEQAALDAMSLWLDRRKEWGKSSVSVNGETVTFEKSDLPPTTRAVLKQYTRRK